MAYTPLHPYLSNGSVFTRDHIAHLEAGITGAEAYAEEAAAKVQAGDINPEVLNAAIDQAVVDGRIPTPKPLPDLTVTETAEGVYNIGDQGQVLGLTEGKQLPTAAKTDLEATFATKAAIEAAGYLTDVTVTNPAPGEYRIGDSGVVQGLTATKTLPDPAKTDVAADLEAPATLIGGAVGRLIKTVRDALTPDNGKRPIGKGEIVVNVRDFGAVGDENTDDTNAIRAAAATLKDGDTLYFPGGTYYISGTIALTKTVSVAGSTATKTVILNKFGNASPFTSTADGVWFRDLFLTSYQTASVVHGNQCTAITFLSGKNCGIERCTFSGWYQWVVFENGPAFTVRDNRFGLCSKYGIVVRNEAFPDNGDSSMYGNMFVTNDPWNADALVRQESSGGLRVFGNKFLSSTLGAARFLDVAIKDGQATSILLVTGNSFEYPREGAIRVTTKGPLNTGVFGKVNITGNQFTGNKVNGAVIDFAYPGGANRLAEVTVAANTMWGHQTFPTGGYVKLGGVDIANITGNQFRGGPLGVDIRSSSRNVMVDKSNFFHEVATPIRGLRVPDRVTFPSDSLVEVDAPRPPAPGLAPSTTGGTLTDGQYRYAVCYRDGSNLLGHLSDIATTTVTGTTGSVGVTWSAWPTISTVARVYRGLGTGDLTEYRDVPGTTLTDTGSGWVAGTHPSTSTYPAVRLGSMTADPLGSGGRPTGWLIGGNWGINTRFPTSDFHVNGSQSYRIEAVTAGAGDVVVTDFARVLLIRSVTANRSVLLPSASGRNGRVITVKDASGQAGAFAVAVKSSTAGQNVNGAADFLLDTPYESADFISDGSNWFTI